MVYSANSRSLARLLHALYFLGPAVGLLSMARHAGVASEVADSNAPSHTSGPPAVGAEVWARGMDVVQWEGTDALRSVKESD